jgi:hypothetical protein
MSYLRHARMRSESKGTECVRFRELKSTACVQRGCGFRVELFAHSWW